VDDPEASALARYVDVTVQTAPRVIGREDADELGDGGDQLLLVYTGRYGTPSGTAANRCM
jgi:hypothetical protein